MSHGCSWHNHRLPSFMSWDQFWKIMSTPDGTRFDSVDVNLEKNKFSCFQHQLWNLKIDLLPNTVYQTSRQKPQSSPAPVSGHNVLADCSLYHCILQTDINHHGIVSKLPKQRKNKSTKKRIPVSAAVYNPSCLLWSRAHYLKAWRRPNNQLKAASSEDAVKSLQCNGRFSPASAPVREWCVTGRFRLVNKSSGSARKLNPEIISNRAKHPNSNGKHWSRPGMSYTFRNVLSQNEYSYWLMAKWNVSQLALAMANTCIMCKIWKIKNIIEDILDSLCCSSKQKRFYILLSSHGVICFVYLNHSMVIIHF